MPRLPNRQGSSTSSAKKLPKNSVGTAQLKNSAVNASKVKDNSLTGADINLSTLATVPSAANADTLDGKHASEFLTPAYPRSGSVQCECPPGEWQRHSGKRRRVRIGVWLPDVQQ